MIPFQLYCWHFMAYPHLPADFDEKYDTGWVTVPNSLWDTDKSRGLYQQYIDQLAYADELGFDGMVLNEHHQNIYGLMPSPNLIAAALTQRTKRGKIVILGNLLPLHLNPLRVAEEYAMLDNMSDGRLIAGFAPGSGPETFNYNVPSAAHAQPVLGGGRFHPSRLDRARAVRASRAGTIRMRYVNPWPQPTQTPHPPIWIPGSRSRDTLVEIAKRGYCYFLSSRSHGKETARSQQLFAQDPRGARRPLQAVAHGHPDVGLCRGDRRAGAGRGQGGRLVLPQELPQGPSAPRRPPAHLRAGHPLHPAGGVHANFLKFSDPTTPLLGDAESWDDLQQSASIIVGSAETVYRRIMEILEHAKVGNLLIQFHLGNMQDALARKSMRLFATEVAPRLRGGFGAAVRARISRHGARAPEMAK